MTPSTARPLTLDLAMRPYELVAAWRPATRNLALVVPDPVHVRQPVQARIRVLGLGVGATILGHAARALPHPFGSELELAPDDLRVRTLERLVEVASGARVTYHARAPRFLAELPATVIRHRHAFRMRTFAVSEGGCGVAWPAIALPPAGTRLDVRVGRGDALASFESQVAWTSPAGRAPAVGLRFLSGDRAAWAQVIDDVRISGAPPA
jgi:hypothetical protein